MRYISGWRNNIFVVKDTEDFSVSLLTKELLDKLDKEEHIIGYVDGEVSLDDFKADLLTHDLVLQDKDFREYFCKMYYFGDKDSIQRVSITTDRKVLIKCLKELFRSYVVMAMSYTALINNIVKDSAHISRLDLSNLDDDKYKLHTRAKEICDVIITSKGQIINEYL